MLCCESFGSLTGFLSAGVLTRSESMGYDNDQFMDEDGEPLMDPDVHSDRELSSDPEEEDWRKERSPTPVLADEDKSGKPRKRLVKKKNSPDRGGAVLSDDGLNDWDDQEEPSSSKKRKAPSFKEGNGGVGGKERRKSLSKPDHGDRSSGKQPSNEGPGDDDGEEEIRELWDTIAGGDSEDDQEGVRTFDDDAFIDDAGMEPDDRFGSDNEHDYAGRAPQAEEGEENDETSRAKGGKKKKKQEKSPAELAVIVEHLMAELEATAEEDAELNMQNKPAITKLKKLPLLTEALSKKNLQHEFLDRGVLTVLKNWLEPLPDRSLPNMNVRTAILKILSDFPIDLEQNDRREQLKKSGLGKVIMFLSRSDEETTSNRKLARELVDKWSRPIFNKSTRYEDMRNNDEERMPYRRPPAKKPVAKAAGLVSRDDDLDLGFSQGQKSSQAASRRHASRPEALPMDFLVRPQSKIDPEEVRARAKNVIHDQRRLQMNKKLQQLKAPKKKQLQASKVSVEGRGMLKYL